MKRTLIATCADILGAKLPDNAGEDSVSILPALLGTTTAPLREAIVHQPPARQLAIRHPPRAVETHLPNVATPHISARRMPDAL